MLRTILLVGAVLTGVWLPASGAPAETPLSPVADTLNDRLMGQIQQAEQQHNGDGLVFSYGMAITSPLTARATLSHLMNNYYAMRDRAKTPTQASQAVDEALLRYALFQSAQLQLNVEQQQKLIEQNNRIIELLEQMAGKTVPAP